MDTVSKTSIATAAALKLGQEPIRSITDLDDDNAILINARFDYCLNSVLRMHDWSSCKQRVILTPTTNTPVFEYQYEFQLPSDLVKILRVSSEGNNVHYEIQQKTINSDLATIQLEYLAYPTDISRMDYLLAEAVASYIAYELAYKVNTDTAFKNSLYIDFERTLSKAKKAERESGRRRKVRAGEWLSARFTGNLDYIPSDQNPHQ